MQFTEGSLAQIRSHGFHLVYCPYETVVEAFASEGVDISTDESTSETKLKRKADAVAKLTESRRENIANRVRELHADQFRSFFDKLKACLNRTIERVLILTLSGAPKQLESIHDAMRYVEEYDETTPVSAFVRYELNVRYTNGDEINGTFRGKLRAIAFLESCLPST